MAECLALELLQSGGWGEDEAMVEQFLSSPCFPLLREALRSLKRESLYISHVHGVGHVERTMVHGAMCAWAAELSEADARLLLTMCAYHDTGRICDYLDGAHGKRSAEKLADLSGLSGEDLLEAMAGIEAHSVGDGLMESILEAYAPADLPRARLLAKLLKDADGLDRVRIDDLDVNYLRSPKSRERGRFARLLFDRYVSLEQARGLNDGAEGFDLPTVRRVRAFVTARSAEGKSCAETALLCWDELGGAGPGAALAAAAGEGEECALLSAALKYFAAAFAGRNDEAREDLCRRFRARFRAQYGAETCAALRSKAGCRGFTVDGILFAWEYYQEEMNSGNGVVGS